MATRSGEKIGGRRKTRGRTRVTGEELPADAEGASPGNGAGEPAVLSEGAAWLEQAWAGRTGVQRAWTDRSWGDPHFTGHGVMVESGAEHLRPFTRTAQVPVVNGGPAAGRWTGREQLFTATGIFPALAPQQSRPRAPLGLVVALWLVVLALLVGIAGLVVHQVRPAWLRSLEVTSTPGAAAPTAASHQVSGGHVAASGSRTTTAGRGAQVHQTQAGFNSATMAVAAGTYEIVVSTQAPCWVQVSSPAHFTPLFSAVMPAGATQTFPSSNGQLTLQFGASKVVAQVRIAGKVVRGWQFSPSAVPFTLDFTSSSG